MSFAFPLLAALAQVTPVAPSVAIRPTLPADWTALAELRFVHRPPANPDLSAFVRDEVAAGRCKSFVRSTSGAILSIDLALLISADGRVKRIVPRAINCVTVEQYAAGVASRLARGNVDPRGLTADTWARTTITFAW